MCEELGDKDSLQRIYGNEALILRDWGRLDEAMALLKKQESLCEELPNKVSMSISYGNQASILLRWGHFDDTLRLLKKQEAPDVPDALLDDPTYAPLPRYWVPEGAVDDPLRGRWDRGWLLGWRDICRSTDERTVIASVIPRVGVSNKFPLMLFSRASSPSALAACLCSFPLDYTARQKLGGTTLNFFIHRQLPVLPPSGFERPAPWPPDQAVADWIRPRVLELVYTAWDLESFARDLGWDGPPFRWDPERRLLLRCELDAAFFHLYGIARDDVDYIFETFPIVRRNDERKYGDYRTKLTILDIYDRMQAATDSGSAYQTLLSPPPADAALAHEQPGDFARLTPRARVPASLDLKQKTGGAS